MVTRAQIIEVVARLLAESPTGEISTRAVCTAAGVQQPVIYRLFGDKDGLLTATVDHVFDQYLGAKRAAIKSADPIDDLRSGWDSHTAFAMAHPHFYKLLFSPTLRGTPEAAEESLRILQDVLQRVADQGRLRYPVEVAARMVMAANTGVALALITSPGLYPDASLSTLIRDALHQAILIDSSTTHSVDDARSAAATTLHGSLDALTPVLFTSAESTLLREWLARIPQADTAC